MKTVVFELTIDGTQGGFKAVYSYKIFRWTDMETRQDTDGLYERVQKIIKKIEEPRIAVSVHNADYSSGRAQYYYSHQIRTQFGQHRIFEHNPQAKNETFYSETGHIDMDQPRQYGQKIKAMIEDAYTRLQEVHLKNMHEMVKEAI